jgi:hypothetical protein
MRDRGKRLPGNVAEACNPQEGVIILFMGSDHDDADSPGQKILHRQIQRNLRPMW